MPRSLSRTALKIALLAAVVRTGGACDWGADELEIELASAEDTTFTTDSGENRIRVRASVPSRFEVAQVQWQVEQGIGGTWAPVTVPSGAETEIPVTLPPGTARYVGSHPRTLELRADRLNRQRVRYRISAVARRGTRSIHSDTLEIEQGVLAAIRQEYLDLGLRRGAPPQDWFTDVEKLPEWLVKPAEGVGYGDYEIAVAETEFIERLEKLMRVWTTDYQLRWQVNGFFRNPVHNRMHVTGGGSGPVSNSWHQFGCAVDLQTFPVLSGGRATQRDTMNARQFWDALSHEALLLDFQVEPRDKNPHRPGASYSGVGHVHLETDCLQ